MSNQQVTYVEWELIAKPDKYNGVDTLDSFNNWARKPHMRGKIRVKRKFKSTTAPKNLRSPQTKAQAKARAQAEKATGKPEKTTPTPPEAKEAEEKTKAKASTKTETKKSDSKESTPAKGNNDK